MPRSILVLLAAVQLSANAATFTAKEEGGRRFCRTVELLPFRSPDLPLSMSAHYFWRQKVHAGPQWRNGFRYEFRRSETADLGEILITAVLDTKGYKIPELPLRLESPDLYAFTPDRDSRPKVISQTEWDIAGPVLQFGVDWDARGSLSRLVHRGDRLNQGFASLSRTTAVLFSASGTVDPPKFDISLRGPKGIWFGDVYHIPTRRRVLQIGGRYSRREPSEFVTHAFWLGKNHFVIPLSQDMRRFYICNIEAAVAASLNSSPAVVKPRKNEK
jgi:hypothetical protein